jgi:hypothetical protein
VEINQKSISTLGFLIVFAGLFAWVAEVIDRPADRSYIERFLFFFVLGALLLFWTHRKEGPAHKDKGKS